MKLVYNVNGVRSEEEVDNVTCAYESADFIVSSPNYRDGDTLRIKDEVDIKFYKRKGKKLYCITRAQEIECLTAL